MSKPDLAIFDLDNTILNGDSDYSMINYLIDINLLDKDAKLKNDEFILDYQQGQLDFNQYTNRNETKFNRVSIGDVIGKAS